MVVPKVKFRFVAVVILFLSILILANTNSVQADWNAMNSGYAVTTDYHGQDVPISAPVTATAGTTNPAVTVNFTWLRPDGTKRSSVIVTTLSPQIPTTNVPQELTDYFNDGRNSTTVYFAQNATTADQAGWWTVKAEFIGVTGPQNKDQTKFRATSFFYIDEVPFGTIVTLLIPFGFLSIYAIKKKHNHIIRKA